MIEQGKTKKGIYDLQGDTLRICFAGQSQERPTKFDSQPNSANDVITVLKRVKAPAHVKPETADEADIQGTWQISGPLTEQEKFLDYKLVLTKETMTTYILGKKTEHTTYKLDPTTSPKSIDITEQGKTIKGIYDLQGDTLRISVAGISEPRPTKFNTNSPNRALKRVKAAAPAKGNEQGQFIDPVKLRGKWQAIYVERSGKAVAPKIARNIQFMIGKNTINVVGTGDRERQSTYTLDIQSNPVAIDLKNVEYGEVTRGIIDLRGDMLRIVITEDEKERPPVFDTTTDMKTATLLIFKRVVSHDAFNFAGDIETEFFQRVEIDTANYPDGELTVEEAKEYTKEKRGVQLTSVTKLSREAAKILAKTQDDLWLPDLEDLQPEILRELLQKKNGRLYLEGFTRTFAGVAAELAKSQCPVSLAGV
jgi:uncharacterized protein (TIGR03067 family)